MPKTRTRPGAFTCTAEVEIDATDLAEAGYHHEDECGLYPVDEAEFEPDWELNSTARAIHKQAGHRLADVAAWRRGTMPVTPARHGPHHHEQPVSSGSYTSPGLGFCNTGKPNATVRACASRSGEPRGPGIYLAGLCCTCGTATTQRDAAGMPRHASP